MHSLSCFFLLHHHFEAVSTAFESTRSTFLAINDVAMSEEADMDGQMEVPEQQQQPPIEPQVDDLPSDTTINCIDEESHFIYDEDSNRLTCIGSNYDDIPQSIIDTFAIKAKVEP